MHARDDTLPGGRHGDFRALSDALGVRSYGLGS
jgi:hypothetical protein